MKKITEIILVCGLAASLFSGCGFKGAAETKSIKIGVTVYDQYDTFISLIMEHFSSYAAQKENESGIAINIETYNASGSQTTQNGQVEDMITDGCDVICVNLVDRTDPTTIIDMAEKNNVPVIFFNRELVEEDLERWNQLYYVGAQAFESGIMQGEIVAESFTNNPKMDRNGDGALQYVILEGEAGHQDAIVRTEYCVSTLVDAGVKVDKLGYAIANWNKEQAQTKMAQLIKQYGTSIELVFANNDDMALGAIEALQDAGTTSDQWPAVVGIDGTDAALEAVQTGQMLGTVYNDKEGQAEAMLNLAFHLTTDKKLDNIGLQNGKYIRLPYAKITKDEVNNYIDQEQSLYSQNGITLED